MFILQNVLNFETWYMDLLAANAQPSVDPVWTLLYDAKVEYALTDLSPASMDRLFTNMLTDDRLFNLYFKYAFPSLYF